MTVADRLSALHTVSLVDIKSANIDGATPLGYNNNTNVNQNDNGGIGNGEEAFEDRGYSQGDRQRSETNTGAESKERRIRTENEEDFVRRVTGASQKSPRITRRLGKGTQGTVPCVVFNFN